MTGLQAAAGTVNLSGGAVGLPMGGNSRRDKSARGLHDPIQATVIAVQRETRPTLIVAFDLVTLSPALVDGLRAALTARVGAHDLFISATHTHSAPDVGHGAHFDQADYTGVDEWVDVTIERVADQIVSTLGELRPARVVLGATQLASVSFNRRLLTTAGRVAMNWEIGPDLEGARPLGPTDDALTVIAFLDQAGSPIGACLHFCLHPAILVGHDWQLSADFVGPARSRLADELGGCPVAFLNGAMGNVNHIDPRLQHRPIGFAESDRVGQRVGAAAVTAHRRAQPVGDGLQSRHITVNLRQRTVTPAELVAAERTLAAAAPHDFDALDGIPAAAYANWTVHRGAGLSDVLLAPVSVLHLGSVVLVYLPFEVFCEFGLQLRALFGDHHVLVVSLGGGGLGYLPTVSAFGEGGYEPTFGTSTIQLGEGERLLDATATLVNALLAGSDTQ